MEAESTQLPALCTWCPPTPTQRGLEMHPWSGVWATTAQTPPAFTPMMATCPLSPRGGPSARQPERQWGLHAHEP